MLTCTCPRAPSLSLTHPARPSRPRGRPVRLVESRLLHERLRQRILNDINDEPFATNTFFDSLFPGLHASDPAFSPRFVP